MPFKQSVRSFSVLTLTLLLVAVAAVAYGAIRGVSDFFSGWLTPDQTFISKVNAVGLREAGDFVALVASNSATEFWEQSDTWTYEGKEIIACCDYDLEYRYDLTKASVSVVDPAQKTIRITLPPVKVNCSVTDLRVLKADGGRSWIGRYRIRESQLNKVLDRAKMAAMTSATANKTNVRMAERSIESTLAALFTSAVGSRSNIEFLFEQQPEGSEIISYDDQQLQRSIEAHGKATSKTD